MPRFVATIRARNHQHVPFGRAGLLACALVLLLLAVSSSAHAHAQLVETEPANEQTIAAPPSVITLRFNEPVSIAFGGIKVFGPDGRRVESGRVKVDSNRIHVRPGRDGSGTYAVAWRATSADSHPVRGAFTYNVRAASKGSVAIDRAREASRRQLPLEIAFGVARMGLLLSVLLLAGGMIFVGVCDPGGRISGAPLWGAVCAVSLLACFLLDAAIAGGFSLAEAVRVSVLSEQAHTSYGQATVARIVVVAVALAVVAVQRRLPAGRGRVMLVAAAVVLAASLSLSGHALSSSRPAVALALDMLHVVAAAAWIGGLMQLAVRSRQLGEPDVVPTAVIERYSRLAFMSVLLIVASGIWASWQRVGLSADAWFSTTYGRLLIVKLGLFVATIPLAAANRLRHVPRLRSGWSNEQSARMALRRYVRVEAVLVIAVVSVTAWLIAQQPAREAIQPQQVQKERPLRGGGLIQLVIDPARAGSNIVHIYALTAQGAPDPGATSITAEANNAQRGINGLDLGMRRAGAGHVTSKVTIPFTGEWTVLIRVERGKFSEERVRIPIRIASAGAS